MNRECYVVGQITNYVNTAKPEYILISGHTHTPSSGAAAGWWRHQRASQAGLLAADPLFHLTHCTLSQLKFTKNQSLRGSAAMQAGSWGTRKGIKHHSERILNTTTFGINLTLKGNTRLCIQHTMYTYKHKARVLTFSITVILWYGKPPQSCVHTLLLSSDGENKKKCGFNCDTHTIGTKDHLSAVSTLSSWAVMVKTNRSVVLTVTHIQLVQKTTSVLHPYPCPRQCMCKWTEAPIAETQHLGARRNGHDNKRILSILRHTNHLSQSFQLAGANDVRSK